MKKTNFLNEKEQAAADNLLGIIAGLTAAVAPQVDVEALGRCYNLIAEAASKRHTAIPNIARLVVALRSEVEETLTLQGDPVIARERAMEDLGIQERTAELDAEFENERRDPGNDPEPTAAVQ